MIYGDLQILDIIIFAAIAGFLVFRLINVLGKRTGHENTQPKFDQKKAQEETIKQTPILPDQYIKLNKAYEALENFDHKNFLDGAKSAFETIINAFNKGDKKTLKPLLSPSVFKSFEIAIDEKKTDPEYQFYSLKIENIQNVSVDKDYIKITIKFVSEQFKNNDENTVIKKQDLWTFEKLKKSKDPSWLLSST